RPILLHLPALPGLVLPQLPGQQPGRFRGDLGAGAGVEEEGAGAAGEDVLDGARHLVTRGPDHLAGAVGEVEVEGLVPAGTLGGEAGEGGRVRAVFGPGGIGTVLVAPA